MRICSVVGLSLIVTACGSSLPKSEVSQYREAHCPLNPHNLKPADFVQIQVSGQKGQVLSLPSYQWGEARYKSRAEIKQFACLLSPKYRVRVNTHGIGLDSGLWDSARPEVLPIIYFEPFEIAPWPNDTK